MPMRLPALVNEDPAVRRWGRRLDATVLLEVGEESWLLPVVDGAIGEVRRGPFALTEATLALRADAEAWREFLSPEPPPMRHDLFALMRAGKLRIEGDLHPFMTHLFWFKGAFAKLREAGR
ncbi:MAG: SCP2 sterol-binding domain-containing protein [Proteobacteria bacterium]|nr:SCP2 sterol-binding domain-containing protein [Pseudomonadota bacterium]